MICPPEHAHGANATCRASHGCLCDDCRQSGTEYAYWRRGRMRAGKPLLVSSVGTVRRIRALHRLGWSQRMIGERMGATANAVALTLRRKSVTAAMAEKVRRVYDELSMRVPVPSTPTEAATISFTRRRAEEAGWPPPLALDDETIDSPDGHVDYYAKRRMA